MAVIDLNVITNGISGRSGSADFANTKNGTVMRSRPKANNPDTPAQQAVRGKLTDATRLYSTLTDAQLADWRDYAKGNLRPSKRAKKMRAVSGINAFTALTTKFLQITPGGEVPLTPPDKPFVGDTVIVTAAGREGAVVFTANHANGTGVKTELLLQKLVSRARVPSKTGYRSQAFAAFAAGSLSATISARKGWYAPAIRFVNPLTGEDMGLVSLPLVQVT